MPFFAGTFSLNYSFTTEAAAPPIEISKLDEEFQGLATGLSNCLLRDGTGLPTAAIPFNSQRITGLGDATADTDALNRQTGDGRYPRLATASAISAVYTHAAGVQTTPVAVAFHATAMALNCATSNVFTTTMTANVTTAPTLSNPGDGQTVNWFCTQDATGSRTMAWPASFKWANGSAGVLSTAANAVDLLVATYRAATGFWYATLLKGFA